MLERDGRVADMTIMVFEGAYDVASKAVLRRAFKALERPAAVVLDLARVTYLDSTALFELLLFSRGRAAAGLEPAVLVALHANLQRLLAISNMSPLFRIVESLDEAIPHDGSRALVRYVSSYADESAS